jgi:hypothetical protein
LLLSLTVGAAAAACNKSQQNASQAPSPHPAIWRPLDKEDGAKNAFSEPFHTRTDHFAKTGSGQTWGKMRKKRRFCAGAGRPDLTPAGTVRPGADKGQPSMTAVAAATAAVSID